MNAFTITLPDSTPAALQEELEAAIQDLQNVDAAGLAQPRSIDPATLHIWVQMAGEIVSTTSLALPIIQKTIDLIRGKGMKNVKINLPNGGSIQVDSASADDVRKMLGDG